MKRLSIILLAATVFAFGLATMAQAQGEQVYIHTPNVSSIPLGTCNTIGPVILEFSGNATLNVGDSATANLPLGVLLCQDIDFFIGNSSAKFVTGDTGQFGAIDIVKPVLSHTGDGVYFRVVGVAGSQSFMFMVLGTSGDGITLSGGDLSASMVLTLSDIYIQIPCDWDYSTITLFFDSQDGLNLGIPKWDFTNDSAFMPGDILIAVAVGTGECSDSDGDGIDDTLDSCPNSDLTSTVVIDGCDTGVENQLFASGCTLSDFIYECAADASNHGQFVRCVSHLTNDLKREGIISGKEKGKIQRCAAKADIP